MYIKYVYIHDYYYINKLPQILDDKSILSYKVEQVRIVVIYIFKIFVTCEIASVLLLVRSIINLGKSPSIN